MTKQAMVWGAAGGIGRAIVTELIDRDWTVFAVGRDTSALDNLTAHRHDADFGDPFAVETAVFAAAQALEKADLWIYAAGDIAAAPVTEMAPADWQRLLNANLTGPFLTVRASRPLLADDAHLIFLGAKSERLQLPQLSAYAAAKAGLEALVAVLAKEERRRRVTVIRPGAVDTPFWNKVPFSKPKNALPADELARQIMTVVEEGQTGVVDVG